MSRILKKWIKMRNFYIHPAPQRDKEWFEIRKKGFITGSISSACANASRYLDQKEAASILRGKEQIFNETAQKHLQRGVELEPFARDRYIRLTGNKVSEVGFIVNPKYEFYGVSVDGLVEDRNGDVGILEIKCPQYLKKYHKIDDIPIEHYIQMLQGMALTETKFCDYFIYVDDDKFFYQRVEFNEKRWLNIDKRLMQFVKKYQFESPFRKLISED